MINWNWSNGNPGPSYEYITYNYLYSDSRGTNMFFYNKKIAEGAVYSI
jgi:hypothetical protein